MIYLILFTGLLLTACFWPSRLLVRNGERYMKRWPLLGGDGLKRAPWFLGRQGSNVFLHLITQSDGPNVHSHPWEAKSFILWGKYRETRQYFLNQRWYVTSVKDFGPGAVNHITGRCFHTIELLTPFALTLCVTKTKHGRGWGFRVGNKVVSASGRGAAAYDEVKGA